MIDLKPTEGLEKSINIVYTKPNSEGIGRMAVKVQKWGNSLGVRIPKSIIQKVNLQENSEVEIESKNGTIVISPVQKPYSLDELLNQITEENLHDEDAAIPEGREVW